MSHAPLRIAVITASTRPGRFGPTVAAWFVDQAERHGLDVDPVDLADLGRLDDPAAAQELGRHVEAADGVVVVTPEYNHSFPGPLKTAIDGLHGQWHAKPVAFVSYGGISGGLRAVEGLRLVFAELHAMTVRETVSFAGAAACFDGSGQPKDADAVAAAATRVLDQLAWWAEALRVARARRPYGQAA